MLLQLRHEMRVACVPWTYHCVVVVLALLAPLFGVAPADDRHFRELFLQHRPQCI